MLVVGAEIPRQIELGDHFIRRVAFKFQLTPHVVIETRCIRAVKIAVRWIVFEILAGGIAVNAFEAAIQAPYRAVLIAAKLLAEAMDADAQVGLLDVRN